MAAPAAASVFERLKALRCPLLDGVFLPEPEAALRLLCAPSAQRLELLAWLCARANPPRGERLAGLRDAQMEEKTQEMARLGSELLLCRSDDLDLVKGEASAERQLGFMRQLLDIAGYLDHARDSTASSAEGAFWGAVRKNEEFLHEVFVSASLPALLAPTLPPCAADVRPLLLEEPAPPQRSRLSRGSRGKALTDLGSSLEEANAALEQLRAERCSLRGGGAPPEPGMALQSLALAAGDLQQLMAAFGQVQQTELQGLGGPGPAPRLSPCGPLAQRLHRALALRAQELRALAQLSDTAEQAVQAAARRHGEDGGGPTGALSGRTEELSRQFQARLAAAGGLPH